MSEATKSDRPLPVLSSEGLGPNVRYSTGLARWTYGAPICSGGKVVRHLLGPCPRCGHITSDYGTRYSCHNDYCPNSARQFACGPDPAPDWWNTDVRVFLDGSAWCAVHDGFTNLQECPAGFGDSPAAAVLDLGPGTAGEKV